MEAASLVLPRTPLASSFSDESEEESEGEEEEELFVPDEAVEVTPHPSPLFPLPSPPHPSPLTQNPQPLTSTRRRRRKKMWKKMQSSRRMGLSITQRRTSQSGRSLGGGTRERRLEGKSDPPPEREGESGPKVASRTFRVHSIPPLKSFPPLSLPTHPHAAAECFQKCPCMHPPHFLLLLNYSQA